MTARVSENYIIGGGYIKKFISLESLMGLVLFLLFVWPLLSTIIVSGIFLFAIWKGNVKSANAKNILILSIPFALCIIGGILDLFNGYIKSSHYARILPFLLFPVIFKSLKFSLKSFECFTFFFGSLLSLLLITYALLTKDILNPAIPRNSIFGLGFVSALGVHPSYIALFFIICLIHSLSIENLYVWIGRVVLIIAIVLTASKINFLALLILIPVIILRSKQRLIIILAGSIILTISMFLYLRANSLRYNPMDRMILLIDYLSGRDEDESTKGRIVTWEYCTEMIKANPIIGYGISFGHKELEMVEGNDKNFNAHNQFLQHYINYGILGLFGLIIYILAPLCFTPRITMKYYLIVIVFALNLLVENLLDRHWGVILVSLYYSLIYSVGQKDYQSSSV